MSDQSVRKRSPKAFLFYGAYSMRAGVQIRLCVCSHGAIILHKSPRKSHPKIMILDNAPSYYTFNMICDNNNQVGKVY